MERMRRPFWREVATPSTLVLYRTPEKWRFAVYFARPGDIADGFLDAPDPSAAPEVAQAAVHLKAEALTHRDLEVSWQAGREPGWWIGVVSGVGPLWDTAARNADRIDDAKIS